MSVEDCYKKAFGLYLDAVGIRGKVEAQYEALKSLGISDISAYKKAAEQAKETERTALAILEKATKNLSIQEE